MIHINKDYISTENTYQGQNAPKYIVVHETDNFAAGANAERHASAQAAGHLSTSVHYYCGSDGVCQAARHSDGTYSVGREYGGSHSVKDATNRNTVNIEICVNSDGDYAKARQNAIGLVRCLMKETGIPAERVIRHYDAKGKHCPRKMIDNAFLWEDFKTQIRGEECSDSSQIETEEREPAKTLKGTVITSHDPLLIRETPGGRKISSIPKGATVEILEQGAEWHHVRYDGYTGYSAAKYISMDGTTQSAPTYVGKCTGNGVRVRSTPDFGDNIIRHLDKGNLFRVLGVSGVWTHVDVEGIEGYMYSEYVAKA